MPDLDDNIESPGSESPNRESPHRESPHSESPHRTSPNSIEPYRPIEPVGDDFPVDGDEAPAPKTKITARGAAIVGVRVVAGTVGLAVALAAIAGATFLPIPSFTATPASVTVTPVPVAQQLVCPGAILRLGDESGQSATTPSTIGAPAVRYAATSGDVDSTPFAGSDAQTGGSASAPTLIGFTAGGTVADEGVLVGGAQSQVAATAEIGGLATADCSGVSSETWLVGGATSVGRTTLITLANPSDTIATVALEISAENGKVSAPGVTGIVVQPHSQRVLPLAGFAPDVDSPVVHVLSRGGQIVANLQQATVRGIEPGGVDIVGSSHSPSNTQVIPGVVVAGTAAVQTRLGEEGFGDLATVLRIFVPGAEQTLAEVSVTNTDGVSPGASFSVDLAPGVVEDLALDGLVDGTYTVQVTTSHPVVSAVRVSTVAAAVVDANGDPTSGGSDFAWLSSADRLDDEAVVTVAPGPGTALHFFNPTDVAAQVAVAQLDGGSFSLTVPAGGAASVGVGAPEGATFRISGFDQLYGSVSYAGDAQISGYGIQPPAAGAEPLTIFP